MSWWTQKSEWPEKGRGRVFKIKGGSLEELFLGTSKEYILAKESRRNKLINFAKSFVWFQGEI